MKENFLEEGRIYYRTNEYHKERKTLVFIHGLSGSSSAWAEFEKKFMDTYNIFSFDLRGHGKSWKPVTYPEYEIRYFAEDIHNALTHLQIIDPILISHSFATLIVLEYLRNHQEKVQAAVLLSPSANANKGVAAKLIQPLLLFSRKLNLFKPSSKRGGHIDYKFHPQKGDWDIKAVIEDIKNTSMRVYLYCTEQSLKANLTSFLPEIRIPVLLIQGRKDGIFPVENSLQMMKVIPNAELKIIEGADHIIVKNNFEEVSDSIDTFVKSL